MIYDLLLAIVWYLILTVFGITVLPLSMMLFRRMPEHGILLSRPLGWLLIAVISWLLGYLLLPFSGLIIGLITLAFFGLSVYLFRNRSIWFTNRFKAHWKTARNGEIITLLVFILILLVRHSDPTIDSTEKPMDAMLLSSLIHSREIPPQDLWLAGYNVNYHYGGYLLHSIPAKLTGIPVEYAYNLSIAGVAAIAAAVAFVLGRALFGRCRYAAFTVVCTLFVGNLASVFNILNYDTWRLSIYNLRFGYLWRSSRAIVDPDGETINEFPFFSIVWGDLHPHFSNIPFFLFFLVLCYEIGRSFWFYAPRRTLKLRWPLLLVTTLACGFLLPTNIFDFPIGSLFLGFTILAVMLHHWFKRDYHLIDHILLAAIALLPIVGYILMFPFWLHFESPLRGPLLQMVPHRTNLSGFLLVFGAHLVCSLILVGVLASTRIRDLSSEEKGFIAAMIGIILVALWATTGYLAFTIAAVIMLLFWGYAAWSSTQHDPNREAACAHFRYVFALIACALAWSLIVGCEIVFIPDNYGIRRMNTLFKIHFPAWMLFGVGLPILIYATLSRWQNQAGRIAAYAAVFALLLLSCIPTAYILGNFYFSRDGKQNTLNGLIFLDNGQPHYSSIINWLNKNAEKNSRILEVPGCGYRLENLASSFTGLPTMLGWHNHEIVWRAGASILQERKNEIIQFYTSQNWEEVKAYLKHHDIDYVVLTSPAQECQDTFRHLSRMQQGAFRDHLEPILVEQGSTWNPTAPYELYKVPEDL